MDIQPQKVLQQVICFSLEKISLWGARRKLKLEDLNLPPGVTLPPKELASLGSKKIFNPKLLSRFEALKKQAHTACYHAGIQFMGGYAIPMDKADDLAKKLDGIGVEFADTKRDFVVNYASNLQKWMDEHPDWKHVIAVSSLTVDEVERRIQYDWVPVEFTMPSGNDTDSPLYKKFEKEVGGLSGQLFSEVSKLAKKFYEDTLLGKDRLLRRSLVHFEKIRSKVSGLSFLDQRVAPLMKAIDETLVHVQGEGPISGLELSAIHGLTLTLCDVKRMKDFGQAMLEGAPASDAWGVVLPPPKQQAAAPAKVVEKVVKSMPPIITESPVMQSVPTGSKPAGYIPNLFDDDPLLAAAFGVESKPVVVEVAVEDQGEVVVVEASKSVIPEQTPVQPHVRVVRPKTAAKPTPSLHIPPAQQTKVFRPITF